MDIGAGVPGKNRLGAGACEDAVGVLSCGTREEEVLADETDGEEKSLAVLSLTGVGGGALTASLAAD